MYLNLRLFVLLLLLACLLCCNQNPKKSSEVETKIEEEWITLFNGKDLNGWTPKITGYEYGDNYGNTFTVSEGAITVNYDDQFYPSFDNRFGHIFYKNPYSNYRFACEYRFLGDQCEGGPGWATRNSGVMLHCQDPKSMTVDQDFPVSLEAQFLGGLQEGQSRSTMNLCTPGTHVHFGDTLFTPHCVNSSSQTYYGDQWVKMEVEVYADSLFRHYVDGQMVLEYQDAQYGESNEDINGQPITNGYLALQSESHPVQFRNIRLKILR